MKPRKPPRSNRQGDLFRVELERIVDSRHALIKMSSTVQRDRLDELFGQTFCPDNGRPAVSTRLMVALHYPKYTLMWFNSNGHPAKSELTESEVFDE